MDRADAHRTPREAADDPNVDPCRDGVSAREIAMTGSAPLAALV